MLKLPKFPMKPQQWKRHVYGETLPLAIHIPPYTPWYKRLCC